MGTADVDCLIGDGCKSTNAIPRQRLYQRVRMLRRSRDIFVRPFLPVLGAILALTAVPDGYRSPSLHMMYWRLSWSDIAINVLLYVPLGVFSPLAVLRTTFVALAISTCAELVQFISPGRFPGVMDIASNGLGALLGAWVAQWICRSGWDVRHLRAGPAAGLVTLIMSGLCIIALFPVPVSGGFSNWDPSFRVVLGDELNGSRHWRGEILGAVVLPCAVDSRQIERLAQQGVPSIFAAEFPASPVLEIRQPVQIDRHATVLGEAAAARLFPEAIRRGQLTILAWIRTADTDQRGPARIVTYSRDALQRNFLLGVEGRQVVFRLRTPATGPNGSDPEAYTPPVLEAGRATFVVATYDGNYSRIYVDGRLLADVNLRTSTRVAGFPRLLSSLFAGVLLFLGLRISVPTIRPQLLAAAAACAGLVYILSLPGPPAPGLAARLVLIFFGGIVAGYHACLGPSPASTGPSA